jgi:hypothetical protein
MSNEQLGIVLGRIYRAVNPTRQIITDGTGYCPSHQAEDLAAELGFSHDHSPITTAPSLENLYRPFVRSERGAAWRRNWRLSTALHVLTKAGADPADVRTVREALGLEVNEDIEGGFDVDTHNERVKRIWAEREAKRREQELIDAYERGLKDGRTAVTR